MKHTFYVLKLHDYVAILFFSFGIGRIVWSGYNTVLLFLGLLWICLVLPWFVRMSYIIDKKVMLYSLFILIYGLIMLTANDFNVAISYFGTYLIYWIILVMSSYYCQPMYINRIKKIIDIVLVWIGIMCLGAIIYYNSHPGAARLYATHQSDLDGYMIGGGYQLAIICSMLLPLCIERIFKHERIYILFSVLMIVLIWKTSSVITIITAALACLVQFAYQISARKRFYMLVVVAVCAFFSGYVGDIIIDLFSVQKTSGIAPNPVFVRMSEIGMLLNGVNVGEILNTALYLRIENYMYPIQSIMDNPLFGSMFSKGVSPESGIHNDSVIITSFACWGIPLTMLYLSPFICNFVRYKIWGGSIFAIIMTLLLNPSMGFSLICGAWLILPALCKINMNYRNER